MRGVDIALHRLAMLWRTRRDATCASRILALLEASGEIGAGWRVLDVRAPSWTPRGVTVVLAGPAGGPSQVAIRLPHTHEGEVSVTRQHDVLGALHQDPRLADWASLVPVGRGDGRIGGQRYLVEGAVLGDSALSRMTDRASYATIQQAAATAIGQLHRRTAKRVAIEKELLERWIDEPLRTISAAQGGSASISTSESVHDLGQKLKRMLDGVQLDVGWIHGDYWPGNIILVPGGVELAGIIDWDRSADEELPWHDVLHLLLYTRRYLANAGLDDLLGLAMGKRTWTPEESRIIAAAHLGPPPDGVGIQALILLYWLRYTAATLTLYPALARDRAFVAREIEPVLATVPRLPS